MAEKLLKLLQTTRDRLNRLILASSALAWAIRFGACALGLCLALRFAGISSGGLVSWSIAFIAGAVFGLVKARISIMGSNATARWLDTRFETGELLASALVCVERGATGRFDYEIISRAEHWVSKNQKIHLPFSRLRNTSAIALALCAFSIASISLTSSIFPNQRFKDGTLTALDRAEAKRNLAAKTYSASKELAELASKSVFPDNQRMAALAQKAIEEGRIDDFKQLMERAEQELIKSIEEAKSALERERLNQKLKELQAEREKALEDLANESRSNLVADYMNNSGGEDGSNSQGNMGSGGSGQMDQKSGANADGTGKKGTGKEGEPSNGETGNGTTAKGKETTQGDSGGTMGGLEPGVDGTGHAKDWGTINPEAEGEQAPLDSKDTKSTFQLAIPGQDPKAALTTLAPAAAQSAESALTKDEVPLDYEEFIRQYFLDLAAMASQSEGESK